MAGIRLQLLRAAAQQEELERLVGKALGRRARLKRPEGPLCLALAGVIRHRDARVRIASQETNKGRRAQVHPFQGFGAVNLLQKSKLPKKSLKLRAGQPPANLPHAPGQLQSARELC